MFSHHPMDHAEVRGLTTSVGPASVPGCFPLSIPLRSRTQFLPDVSRRFRRVRCSRITLQNWRPDFGPIRPRSIEQTGGIACYFEDLRLRSGRRWREDGMPKREVIVERERLSLIRSIPRSPFVLEIAPGITSLRDATNRSGVFRRFAEHDDRFAAHFHQEVIPRFHFQRFASLSRDHNLVLT